MSIWHSLTESFLWLDIHTSRGVCRNRGCSFTGRDSAPQQHTSFPSGSNLYYGLDAKCFRVLKKWRDTGRAVDGLHCTSKVGYCLVTKASAGPGSLWENHTTVKSKTTSERKQSKTLDSTREKSEETKSSEVPELVVKRPRSLLLPSFSPLTSL